MGEIEAVRMSYCRLWEGGWVGGWVGRTCHPVTLNVFPADETVSVLSYILGREAKWIWPCLSGWVGGWVGGWVQSRRNSKRSVVHIGKRGKVDMALFEWVGGWVGRWVGGWVDEKVEEEKGV